MWFSMFKHLLTFFVLILLASCSTDMTIVNNVDEREANEIIVFLASKGIEAQKVTAAATGIGAQGPSNQFNIVVPNTRMTDAMSILNRYGLPRPKGTSLLEIFAKSGLMSSEREETIRYQSGLAEELKGTIRKIDGVVDADVQISFPPSETTLAPGAILPKTTSAVYIKLQGAMEDPNSHIETKIKRLLAGSVSGLDFENVSVITDRSRFTDITLDMGGQPMGKHQPQAYVNIWSIVMTKGSLGRFRFIFFSLILLLLLFGGALGWLVYKFYPQLELPFRKKAKVPPENNEPELNL